MPRYAELVYNGMWFTPEREALQVGGVGGGGLPWAQEGCGSGTEFGSRAQS